MINQTTQPPSRILGIVGGKGCELAELGAEIVDDVDYIDQIDARSDAYFLRAYQRAARLARGGLAPWEIAEQCRLISHDIAEGKRLDDLEDKRRRKIGDAGGEVQQGGQLIVTSLRAYAMPSRLLAFPGRGPGGDGVGA